MRPLKFLLLCDNTSDDLAELAIHPDDAHLLSSNPRWMIQAQYRSDTVTFGAYRGDQAVAMMSLIDPRLLDDDGGQDCLRPNCLYVWRLMVDQRYRRQGVARQMIAFAQGYANLIGLKGLSLTTMDTEHGNALPLYTKLGFIPTGRRMQGEIELFRP